MTITYPFITNLTMPPQAAKEASGFVDLRRVSRGAWRAQQGHENVTVGTQASIALCRIRSETFVRLELMNQSVRPHGTPAHEAERHQAPCGIIGICHYSRRLLPPVNKIGS